MVGLHNSRVEDCQDMLYFSTKDMLWVPRIGGENKKNVNILIGTTDFQRARAKNFTSYIGELMQYIVHFPITSWITIFRTLI